MVEGARKKRLIGIGAVALGVLLALMVAFEILWLATRSLTLSPGGSRVWFVISVLFNVLNTAARRVVPGIGSQVRPPFLLRKTPVPYWSEESHSR